jgi:signal transduction histidine kinase/CheY-like chemotaxis protein
MLTIRRRYDNAVFFGLFVVLNDKLRGWYAALDPTAVRDGIPGHEPGSLEHVDSFHALCATLIFATALAFNINAAAWSSHGSKYRLNLQVAYISAVAAWTHREMWLGNDWYVTYRGAATPKAKNGLVSFSGLRQLEWVFTTPVLLLLVQNLHAYAFAALPRRERAKEAGGEAEEGRRIATNDDARRKGVAEPLSSASRKKADLSSGVGADAVKNVASARDESARVASRTTSNERAAHKTSGYVPVNRVLLIAVDVLMLLCGLVMPLTSGAERFAFLLVSLACFVYVVGHSVAALFDILRFAKMGVFDSGRVVVIAALKCVAWAGYPAIYFTTEWGLLSCKQQHDLYLYNDVLTKFTYSLVISAGSLRFIEALDDRRASFAVHMSNVQRAFFFNITHELRTPLNSIIGFNTLAMESGELTDFTNSFIKASLTSAEALLGLINQILDFAKFEGAKDESGGSSASIELSEDVWTIRQLIEQVTDISQKASSRGVELVMLLAKPEHFNTRFVGDFFRLRQCCINLVDNAIKYSSNVEGRTALVEFSVDVRAVEGRPHTSQILFEVRDNGVGIPVEKQHALFVPFCQPADHKTAKAKGTGLGLVITKAIIECMGGSIDFESVEDQYTRFFFSIDSAHAQATPRVSFSASESANGRRDAKDDDDGADDAENDDETDDFVEDEFDLQNDRLPPGARVVFHPSVNENTRKHIGCVLKCFGARPGVHYVTVQREEQLAAKVKQAAQLGSPIILTDVDGVKHALEFSRAQPLAAPVGVLVFGLPYQLMELHRTIADEPNVQFVLKPVKPSDLLRAVTRLANITAAPHEKVVAGDADWLHDSLGGDPFAGDLADRLEAAGLNAAQNTIDATRRNELDDMTNAERAARARRDSYTASRSSSDDDAARGAGAAASTDELRGMSVLLVEDNLMNQQMAKYSIVKAGADLEVANHGLEAVEMIKKRLGEGRKNYDCVLMDMMMPVMDGAEATREIRRLEKISLKPNQKPHVIVGLSANVGPEYTAKVKLAGMNGSMSKPFYPATLRATLANVMNGTYQGFARVSGEGRDSVHQKPGN